MRHYIVAIDDEKESAYAARVNSDDAERVPVVGVGQMEQAWADLSMPRVAMLALTKVMEKEQRDGNG